MNERGVSPVVGVAVLLAVTVLLAAGLVVTVETAAEVDPPAPSARFDLSADPTGRIVLVHRGGDTVDVRDLRLTVAVDDRPLADQPPVPFFSAPGFVSGPSGPFNTASDPHWRAGERAALTVASTNSPTVGRGSRVRVRLYVEDQLVWEGSTLATAGSVGVHSGTRATVVMAMSGS